jgi:hypothetical protein
MKGLKEHVKVLTNKNLNSMIYLIKSYICIKLKRFNINGRQAQKRRKIQLF